MKVFTVLVGLFAFLVCALAQGPPIRDEWRRAARKACGGLEAKVDSSAVRVRTREQKKLSGRLIPQHEFEKLCSAGKKILISEDRSSSCGIDGSEQ